MNHIVMICAKGTCMLARWSSITLALAAAGLAAAGVTPATERRAAGPPADDAAFAALVEADWARQEQRLGREPTEAAAVQAAIERGAWLIGKLRGLTGSGDAPAGGVVLPGGAPPRGGPAFRDEERALDDLRRRAGELDRLEPAAREALWLEARRLARSLALANPLLAGRQIIYLERRRFVCQMLHEYMGYYCDYGDIEGGGVRILERPGRTAAVRDLTGDRLGRGNFTTLALSFDGRTAYFAFAPRAPGDKPGFYTSGRRCFHIHALSLADGALRQLTDGPHDDFDPCPLPDGGIAFMSSRRGGFVRCNNPWEPVPAYTLHRMDPGGGNIRTLSFHETNEWHPSVLRDGRIAYIRWDYVDRSAANYHGIWTTNPDGTGVRALFGNYTEEINACYQPRAVPGSDKIVFVAGAHHADVGGSLVLLDPAQARLDPETGHDHLDAIERLTPEVAFPEAAGWPSSWFHAPWPLSEDFYLVGFSHEGLPGMSSGVGEDVPCGIYLFDRRGGLELLIRKEGISCMYPILLAPRPAPPAIPSCVEPDLAGEGEFLLRKVSQGHFPLPADRPAALLRVFQVLPKSESHVANQPRIGHANAESARMLLGTVPVEADGSAWFRAPAGKPLYFQAVDADGRAVQGMRSVVYLQPGERRSCVGCHEPAAAAPPAGVPLALGRGPSRIEPGPDGSLPWSFQRLVQPILDRRCTSCHDGSGHHDRPGSSLDLTNRPGETFTTAYESLRPFIRWYEWGRGIGGFATRPGHMPADESPLRSILLDPTHAPAAGLDEEETRRLYLWLDGNAAFYGTYSEAERRAQGNGEQVPPPALQ